jgi:hypothetical protein
MAQSIILKRSATPGKVPNTSTLNVGEIAINTYDGKIFLNRSGSISSIQEIITTNVTNTGSITLTQTGSFGELSITQDANIQRDLYVIGDVITNGDLDISGSITGSSIRIEGTGSFESLQVNNTLTVNHGETIISGSQLVTSDLTVLGAVNARQFNISVISSSVIYQSGSTKFGDTTDDIHEFTGSISISGQISASLFSGDGSGLTNIQTTFDPQTAQITSVDGNVLLNNSIADLFLQLGANGYVDFDFNN